MKFYLRIWCIYVLCFFNRTRQICLLPPVPSPPICFPQESQMIFWNHHSKHVPTCLKNLLEPHPGWELGLCGSISFPGLRQQITTNWMACNTNSLSHSSGKRESKLEVSAEPGSLWRFEQRILSCFFRSWWFQVLLGPWQLRSVLSCLHTPSPLRLVSSSDTCLCIWGPHR